MKRTDQHRPSAIRTEEYTFVAFEHVKMTAGAGRGAALFQLDQRKIIEAHMQRTGGTYSAHAHGGNCMVCGNANAQYTILFYHEPSNSYVRTGQDCAVKMEMGYPANEFNAFRRRMENALEAQAGKRKAEKILTDAGLQACWALYVIPVDPDNNFRYEELTIRDIVGKLVKYGSVSEKQTSFLRSLLSKIDNRAAVQAQRIAEAEAAAPCPSGRVKIVGEVLGLKETESNFGPQTKLLIRDSSGFKVYGNRFAGLEKGALVEFVATVEVSQNDSKFGFYKRPAKVKILEDKQ